MKTLERIFITTMIVVSFGVIIFSSAVTAQNEVATNLTTGTQPSIPQPLFEKIHLVGKGLAVSNTNSTDIHVVTIAVAEVNLNSLIQKLSQYVTLPPGIPTMINIGVFHFDDTSYTLKNIIVTNNTISANIYLNTTNSGSINLEWTTKAGRVLWIGNLTLNGNLYNTYLLEGIVPYEAAREDNQIQQGCQEDPGQCSVVANSTQSAAIYCSNNPNDVRCIGLKEAYCRTNLDDSSCRTLLLERCTNGANSTTCNSVCEDHPGICGKVQRPTHFSIMPIHMPSVEVNENSSETGSIGGGGLTVNTHGNQGIGVSINGG